MGTLIAFFIRIDFRSRYDFLRLAKNDTKKPFFFPLIFTSTSQSISNRRFDPLSSAISPVRRKSLLISTPIVFVAYEMSPLKPRHQITSWWWWPIRPQNATFFQTETRVESLGVIVSNRQVVMETRSALKDTFFRFGMSRRAFDLCSHV